MMADGCVEDGTVATAPSKQGEIWQLRERIAEALLRDGYCYKVTLILDILLLSVVNPNNIQYDISLPLSVFYDSITVMRERLAGDPVTRVVG